MTLGTQRSVLTLSVPGQAGCRTPPHHCRQTLICAVALSPSPTSRKAGAQQDWPILIKMQAHHQPPSAMRGPGESTPCFWAEVPFAEADGSWPRLRRGWWTPVDGWTEEGPSRLLCPSPHRRALGSWSSYTLSWAVISSVAQSPRVPSLVREEKLIKAKDPARKSLYPAAALHSFPEAPTAAKPWIKAIWSHRAGALCI